MPEPGVIGMFVFAMGAPLLATGLRKRVRRSHGDLSDARDERDAT